MREKPLAGKVAIVTGAASPIGLGRAMTEALVGAGALVAMLDINEDWLDSTANDIREIGGDDRVLPMISMCPTPTTLKPPFKKPSTVSAGCTSW